MAQAGGQDLLEFGQGPHRGLLYACEAGAVGGGCGHYDGQGDGFLVVEDQGWKGGAGAQVVAAVVACGAFDRVAQPAQPVDVTADGAQSDAQALGEFGAGPLPARLEQGEQAQHPCGQILGHGTSLIDPSGLFHDASLW
ncbi:hypothetical protein SAZ_00520 [Streptomyces noursei ZPM]|nr:hypothetical protein SAZ_00520 [Streptomyces noursei ZPM]EXU92476.1 hypothetical protein P354_21575 [Streptomyces noursei PD-1]